MKPLDIDEWSEEPEKPEHRRLVIVLTRSQWIRLDEYEQKK
jgi:hypothetical protein